MKKLYELTIAFDIMPSLENMTDFYNAVEKMPQLKSINGYQISHEETLEFTCKAIIMAVSQNKDIIVLEDSSLTVLKRLKIESKRPAESDDEKCQTLTLEIHNHSKTYFNDVVAFVRRTLKGHRVFELK